MNHPFYVKGQGFIAAGKLSMGDEIMNVSGGSYPVECVELEEKQETVYNFQVEDYHTYYVGENSVLVHNDCPDGETPTKGGSKTNELVLKGTEYSTEYAQKLKDIYKVFQNNGYEISEHGLNRVLGRINQGKIGSLDDVIDALNNGTKYRDTVNGGTILFKNGISIHVAEDGFVKTVIGKAKVKSTWEVIN